MYSMLVLKSNLLSIDSPIRPPPRPPFHEQ